MMRHKQSMGRWIKDVHFYSTHLCRTPVYRFPGFEIIVIGWQPGQYSAIHDHASSCGAVMVLAGECIEEQYHLNNNGNAVYDDTSVHDADAIALVKQDIVHRVGNSREAPCNLITLHVRVPPLKGKMTIYSKVA